MSCPLSDATPPTIWIQAISVYGQTRSLTQSVGYPVKPVAHDPGGTHSISVYLVADASGHNIKTIQDWAASGECFIRLDWTFSEQSYPSFTTRHLLVMDSALGEVGFSGGLGRAQRMSQINEFLGLPSDPLPPPPRPSLCPVLANRTDQPAVYGPLRAHFFTFPEPADDNMSVCSDLTAATTISEPDMSCSFDSLAGCGDRFSTNDYPSCSNWETFYAAPELYLDLTWIPDQDIPRDHPSPYQRSNGCHRSHLDLRASSGHAPESNLLPGQSLCRDYYLQQQKREAHALYARNGDTSGFLAVVASTSQMLTSWDQSRFPGIQPDLGSDLSQGDVP